MQHSKAADGGHSGGHDGRAADGGGRSAASPLHSRDLMVLVDDGVALAARDQPAVEREGERRPR